MPALGHPVKCLRFFQLSSITYTVSEKSQKPYTSILILMIMVTREIIITVAIQVTMPVVPGVTQTIEVKNNFGERDGNFAEKYQLLLTDAPARVGIASTLTSIRNGDLVTNVTIQITLKVVLDSGAIQPTPMFDGSGALWRMGMLAYSANKCRPWFAVTLTNIPTNAYASLPFCAQK